MRDQEQNQKEYFAPNIVTVALALGGKQLNKTIFEDDSSIAFKRAYHYKYFSKAIEDLGELCQLVRYLLHRPRCCLLRGIAKDDTLPKQRRLLNDDRDKGDAATIIEQEQNWYALDIDNYDKCSGNLREDAKTVLLALGIPDVQAFAIPSASYLNSNKPGINIRLFLWNSMKLSCMSLKKHYTTIVDPGLFSPIQLIYTARPTFVGRNDPCQELIAWLPGDQMHTTIQDTDRVVGSRSHRLYKRTKKEAENILRSCKVKTKDGESVWLWDLTEGKRHPALYLFSSWIGELVYQELLEEDEAVEEIVDKCMYYWRGNNNKDRETVLDGIKNGKLKGERDDEF